MQSNYKYKKTHFSKFHLCFLEYKERKKEIEKFNSVNRWKKRGISTVPMKFHIEYFGSCNAIASVYKNDGSVSITHGGIEMGQGLNTKAAQTASHILGIPLRKISIKPTNNHTAPNAIVTGGSLGELKQIQFRHFK